MKKLALSGSLNFMCISSKDYFKSYKRGTILIYFSNISHKLVIDISKKFYQVNSQSETK